jgi:hypothetical protein
MRVTGNKVLVGVTSNQTSSRLTSRQNGSSIEFGHGNQSGQYYGTLGCMSSSGAPFIAFSADNTIGNSFTTRGAKGFVISQETSINGDLIFSALTGDAVSHQSLAIRMKISNAGNVGIGTTNPSQKLEIRDETATHKLVSINRPASDTAALYIGNDSSSPSNGVISSNYSDLIFGRDQSGALTEHMRIERDGNVGIGNSSPGDYDVSDNPILAVGNTATANNSSQISVLSGSNGFGYLLFGDGETGNEAYRGQVRYDHPNDSLEFVTAGSERMQITSAGYVGIGDNPSFKLDVNVTSDRARFKAATGDANIELSSIAGRDWLISSLTDGSLRFYDEDAISERMRIDSSGRVGIGTTSPSEKLEVNGNSTFTGSVNISGFIYHVGDTDSYFGFGANNVFDLATGGTRKLYADNSGLYIYYNGSQRLKTTSTGVTVTGDLEIANSSDGIILESPDGTRYRVTVANGGTLSVSAV